MVNIRVKTRIEGEWIFTTQFNCKSDAYAILLAQRMSDDMQNKLESIRREYYNLGWKEAKSKKSPKRTWFSGWW